MESGSRSHAKYISDHKVKEVEFVLGLPHQSIYSPCIKQRFPCIQVSPPCSIRACLYLREEEQANIFEELRIWSYLPKSLNPMIQYLSRTGLMIVEKSLILIHITVLSYCLMQGDQT
jgi:hypothetical protein